MAPNKIVRRVDLRGIDLSRIDQSDLEPEHEAGRIGYWLMGALLVGTGFGLAWLQQSEYYRITGKGTMLFFALCALACGLGVALGRWLWIGAQSVAARTPPRTPEPWPDEPPPTWIRRLMLVGMVGAGAAIVWLAKSNLVSEPLRIVLAIVGLGIALMFSRWIIMSAQAAERDPEQRPPIKLPPWFKWVSLAGLVGLGLIAGLGDLIFPNRGSGPERFGLAGVGLFVGVFGAIWLAKRLDETEDRIRRRRRP